MVRAPAGPIWPPRPKPNLRRCQRTKAATIRPSKGIGNKRVGMCVGERGRSRLMKKQYAQRCNHTDLLGEISSANFACRASLEKNRDLPAGFHLWAPSDPAGCSLRRSRGRVPSPRRLIIAPSAASSGGQPASLSSLISLFQISFWKLKIRTSSFQSTLQPSVLPENPAPNLSIQNFFDPSNKMIEYRADPERYLILGPPSPCFPPSSYISSPKEEAEIEEPDLLHAGSVGLPRQRTRHQHAKGSTVQLSANEARKQSIPDLTVVESRWVASERRWVYKLRKTDERDGKVYVSADGSQWFAEDDVSPA
ncbi:uncharacterized protein J3D65DRAFT_420516 [Phyllosticta citribraziliensis]|uniref:Uncharacterized protein n=1 Tax=Phyllosticta citribraziliensis TaxID=989973 RepID=A0ABR1LHM2_9PEZI